MSKREAIQRVIEDGYNCYVMSNGMTYRDDAVGGYLCARANFELAGGVTYATRCKREKMKRKPGYNYGNTFARGKWFAEIESGE